MHERGIREPSDAPAIAGQGLGAGELAVPVLLYGAAHSAGQSLADIRRACGYFKGAQHGRFEGSGDVVLPSSTL